MVRSRTDNLPRNRVSIEKLQSVMDPWRPRQRLEHEENSGAAEPPPPTLDPSSRAHRGSGHFLSSQTLDSNRTSVTKKKRKTRKLQSLEMHWSGDLSDRSKTSFQGVCARYETHPTQRMHRYLSPRAACVWQHKARAYTLCSHSASVNKYLN